MTASPKGTGTIQVAGSLRHSRITGIGAYRPRREVPNSEIIDKINSSDEWIRERSGIESRHVSGDGESVVDMAELASREALSMAGIAAEQIGLVILATVTHPFQTPAAAPEVAARLGSTAPALDISAACAGYAYAISMASDSVRAGSADHVLVIGVERLSDFTDPYDRGSAFIFGDGAGAAVVSVSDIPGIGPTVWGSDGQQRDVITQRESWVDVRHQWEQQAAALTAAAALNAGTALAEGDGAAAAAGAATSGPADANVGDERPKDPWPAIGMQGQSVFRWAVWGMAPVARRAMEAAGVQPEDLDAFIPHQANVRIIDAMVKQLKLPADIPVARDIRTTANTSAASIPIATARMLAEGEAPRGGLALQIGFGAGLVYAAQVVLLP